MARNSKSIKCIGWTLATCAYGEMEQLGSKKDNLMKSHCLMRTVMVMIMWIKKDHGYYIHGDDIVD